MPANIIGPEKWVTATWLGGRSAIALGGNRPRCGATCTGPARPPFHIVWEPNMSRGSMPRTPSYRPGPPECP